MNNPQGRPEHQDPARTPGPVVYAPPPTSPDGSPDAPQPPADGVTGIRPDGAPTSGTGPIRNGMPVFRAPGAPPHPAVPVSAPPQRPMSAPPQPPMSASPNRPMSGPPAMGWQGPVSAPPSGPPPTTTWQGPSQAPPRPAQVRPAQVNPINPAPVPPASAAPARPPAPPMPPAQHYPPISPAGYTPQPAPPRPPVGPPPRPVGGSPQHTPGGSPQRPMVPRPPAMLPPPPMQNPAPPVPHNIAPPTGGQLVRPTPQAVHVQPPVPAAFAPPPAQPQPAQPQRLVAPKRQPKARTPKRKERETISDLAIREIAGHLTFTRNDVTAWYSMPELQWAFRGDKERTSVILGIAAQYAALAGYRLHLRRTTRPYPAADWARRLAEGTRNPLPNVPGAPSWSDHLEASQHRLHNTSLAEGEVYLGVVFQRRTLREQAIEVFNALRKNGVGEAERARLAQLVSRFDEVLGAFGMQARPATARQLEWLMHRSVALCMPARTELSPVSSDRWETGDLLAFTEHTRRYRTRYGNTVRVVTGIGDEMIERHVAVLTFGRMEELAIPERHEPWLHFHEQLPWSMELSSRVDVLGAGDALKSLEHKLLTIRSQQRDYFEHEMDPPAELERLAQRALDITDEMATGMDLDATRVHGWHRLAVGAPTQEECLKRVRAVIDHYRNMRITVQHPKDQLRLMDEFIPGQPVANTGYTRRMPAKYFAAALPQAAATIGDRRGPIIGETCGTSRRPVMWDPHFATEVRERSGLAVFVAEPGGGKSTLMGGIAYLAARRGVQCTILDPSGPLARLADMPELKPYSRVFNLTRGEPGTLAPYALIPTPRREYYPSGETGASEWRSAVASARAERKALAQDICTMLLPPQVARERSTPILLQRAARQIEPAETTSLDDLVAAVAGFGDEGAELAETLNDVRDMPLSRLFFGPSPGRIGEDEAVLTVVTMAGLSLPDLTIDREYWQLEERMALPMLHLATAFTTRRAYGRGMHERKLVALDETHFLAGWGSGRALFTRLARDSRKWNIAALAASQNPIDILGLDVQNLVSTIFVGKIAEDPEIAAQALRMLNVQRGVGYENTLAQLSAAEHNTDTRLGYREFVMRDVDGRVQKFRVDLSYVDGLLTHLDTTAGSGATASSTGEAAA